MRKSQFIFVLMLSTALGLANAYASSSGTCGEHSGSYPDYVYANNCTWTLDDNGVLTISGSGKMGMAEYQPWRKALKDSVTSVVVENGITSLGWMAFAGLKNVTSISLPNTLTDIGYDAFGNMTAVTELNIPNSVTKIQGAAFNGMTGITELVIPDSVTEIQTNAFMNMNNLQSLTISENFHGKMTDVLTNLIDGGAYRSALSDLEWAQVELEMAQEWGEDMAMYQEDLERAQARVDAAKANLLANTDLFKINCRGDVELCKANLLASLPAAYREVLGTKVPFQVNEATYEEPDGHGGYTIKTYGGKIVGYKNKRIYTVEEATAVSKPTGNTFRLRYK